VRIDELMKIEMPGVNFGLLRWFRTTRM